jgi:hypothetical protein
MIIFVFTSALGVYYHFTKFPYCQFNLAFFRTCARKIWVTKIYLLFIIIFRCCVLVPLVFFFYLILLLIFYPLRTGHNHRFTYVFFCSA